MLSGLPEVDGAWPASAPPAASPVRNPRRDVDMVDSSLTAYLMLVQPSRVHREPDDELPVWRAAPQADVLQREIDGHGIGDLVLDAFEDRNLALDAGGFFPEPVDVRRQVAQGAGRHQPKAIACADIECSSGIAGRRA